MGRRSEPRIEVCLPVVVRGSDSQGRPFSGNAETHDISASGASLRGLAVLIQRGQKIEIEFREQSAWFRVEWVGSNGSSRAGRIGVRCLERKYIGNLPAAPWEVDTYNDSSRSVDYGVQAGGGSGPWNGAERRAFPRRTCRIETAVCTADSSLRVPGKITDLSLNGCYIEMLSPFPVGAKVDLDLILEGAKLHLAGNVRTSQTGMGMGVTFAGITPADFEQLRRFAPPPETRGPAAKVPVPSTPNPVQLKPGSPPPDAVPHSVPAFRDVGRPTTAEAFETVLRILLRKGIVTREELSAEFEKLKASKT